MLAYRRKQNLSNTFKTYKTYDLAIISRRNETKEIMATKGKRQTQGMVHACRGWEQQTSYGLLMSAVRSLQWTARQQDGFGESTRVSLTEPPEEELDPCRDVLYHDGSICSYVCISESAEDA
ncbi:uncharacterized protein LOC126409694 [Nymphaea colorata]|uniref:uncharacterized protein LOC126409694 n=1 Tax=Nymphaea colorata TaxID=210225 RepID=UPI00214EB87A|nr:uncharacterized protein LOC126409694 [Nymphaea colorata]